jgi:hypothetical protein
MTHVTTIHRFAIVCAVIVIAALAPLGASQPSPQDIQAVDHAKRMFQLLRDDKIEEMAKEFTAQMTAAMSPEQLRAAWGSVLQQAGAFGSILDEQVERPQPGFTVVVFGCQFGNAAVNAMFAFDADNKLAGLRFTPRQ